MADSDRRQETQGRLRWVAIALAAFGVVLLLQLARWQLLLGPDLAAAAKGERLVRQTIEPRRGTVYSRDGRPIAADIYTCNLSAAPTIINRPSQPNKPFELADRLFPLIGAGRDDLVRALRTERAWYPLADNLPLRVADEIQSWGEPGLYVQPALSRAYPEPDIFSPLVGFVNRARDGYYGVEGFYDAVLRGEPGARLGELDAFGQNVPFGLSLIEPPRDGADITLTVDSRVQYVLWRELREGLELYRAESGTIIVMDPRTGAVLGQVSLPGYDPNRYESADAKRFEDPAVSHEHEPGSVFKIITMAAGLDSHTVTPDTIYNDTGSLEIAGITVRNWDREAHGLVTMSEVLQMSLNTGAAYISTTMGAEAFYRYVAAFGFGRPLGIDLQAEAAGSVKSPGDGRWYEADLATNSFGQGLAATPLQMTASVAAVANDGLLMRPYYVESVSTREGVQRHEPEPIRQVISPETARMLSQMLVDVVREETTGAMVPGYSVAGKTGTAQIPIPGGYHPSDTIASFVGYLPAHDPQLVILVKIDRPQASQWGSQVAAPVFAEVASELVRLLGIPPDAATLAQGATP